MYSTRWQKVPLSFLLYIILECALKAFFLTLWITCISCKYSFIDFNNFLSCLLFPSFKQISTMLPFLSFLLDFCESWSLAEGEEQSSKNPCSHHEATSARSVHHLCNCWVSCVRSADAAFFVSVFLPGHQICGDCWGREGVKKQNYKLPSYLTTGM